jgi:DeoR/GlpR family transcriptional regulator of sugar metabolism
LLVEERLEKIRQILMEKKTVNITTLCEILEVSDVTVRKDLERLEKEQFLTKIHGGAVLSEGAPERYMQQKEDFPFNNEKIAIAEKALDLIGEFDNLFIGPGSSCYIFAKMLYRFQNVRVITNNLNAINILYNSVKRLYVLGGEIGYRDNMMFSTGDKDLRELDNIFLNKAIVTYNGIDLETGFTLDELSLVNIYSRIFSISKEVIVLASENKFNLHSMYPSRRLEEVDYLVTNKKLEDQFSERFDGTKVKVLIADKN